MRVGHKITELSTWRLYQVLTMRQTLLYLFLFVGCVTVDAQERPRVVRTSPENGAMSVDPATNELRVTFDQSMLTGVSFVGGGPTAPEVVGRPQWISNTTIVLPIRLKPDHAYWLSINSDRHQDFRGTNGLPAVPYPISFRTAPSGTVDSLSQELNRESLTQLRSAIEDRYSHRDLRGVDWDARFAEFESRLIDAKTRAQFATLAGQLLEVARDIHIWLKVDDEIFASFRRSVSPNVDLELIKKTIPEFRFVNDAVATGRFQDGPAYLLIGTWRREQAGDIEAAAAWIDGLSSDDTLILDVRFNSGGAEQLAREIAGRFVEHPVVYAQHRFRDPSMPSGFSEIMTRTLNPMPSVPGFRGRTVVLMGPVNVSSCEAFLLMMKQVPQCTLMGEKSYGSSGNPQPISLSNGVTVFLPSWVAFTPDGDPFEEKGLSPDVHVAFSTDTTGEDPLINAALDFLLARPDFNGDSRVDFADFLLFVQQFGLSRDDEGYDARYDLDSDGTIGFGDFLIFASAFGK